MDPALVKSQSRGGDGMLIAGGCLERGPAQGERAGRKQIESCAVGAGGTVKSPSLHTHPKRPSMAAAPPGMILVMKMPGSSGMWGLSIPPAMLKPRPELPCRKAHGASVPRCPQNPVSPWAGLLRAGSGCVAEEDGCSSARLSVRSARQMEQERGSRQDLPHHHVSVRD